VIAKRIPSGVAGLILLSGLCSCGGVGPRHFTWHAFREGAFGIYQNDSGPPDPAKANDPLIVLFRRMLG